MSRVEEKEKERDREIIWDFVIFDFEKIFLFHVWLCQQILCVGYIWHIGNGEQIKIKLPWWMDFISGGSPPPGNVNRSLYFIFDEFWLRKFGEDKKNYGWQLQNIWSFLISVKIISSREFENARKGQIYRCHQKCKQKGIPKKYFCTNSVGALNAFVLVWTIENRLHENSSFEIGKITSNFQKYYFLWQLWKCFLSFETGFCRLLNIVSQNNV